MQQILSKINFVFLNDVKIYLLNSFKISQFYHINKIELMATFNTYVSIHC